MGFSAAQRARRARPPPLPARWPRVAGREGGCAETLRGEAAAGPCEGGGSGARAAPARQVAGGEKGASTSGCRVAPVLPQADGGRPPPWPGKCGGAGGVSRAASGEGRGRAGDRRGRLERGRPGGPGGLRKGGRGRRAACRVYVCVSVPPPRLRGVPRAWPCPCSSDRCRSRSPAGVGPGRRAVATVPGQGWVGPVLDTVGLLRRTAREGMLNRRRRLGLARHPRPASSFWSSA